MSRLDKLPYIQRITIQQAKELPGLLGKIAAQMLLVHGEYKCVVGGKKIHYVLIAKEVL